jgi:hypothetical protein
MSIGITTLCDRHFSASWSACILTGRFGQGLGTYPVKHMETTMVRLSTVPIASAYSVIQCSVSSECIIQVRSCNQPCGFYHCQRGPSFPCCEKSPYQLSVFLLVPAQQKILTR